jgi:hypothetical protein
MRHARSCKTWKRKLLRADCKLLSLISLESADGNDSITVASGDTIYLRKVPIGGKLARNHKVQSTGDEMTDLSHDGTAKTDRVPAWMVLLIGICLFVVAVALLITHQVGPQFFGFLMCVGLGLVFAAAGDQGELQAKSGDGLSWLGGLTIPFARFVGGAAVAFLLLMLLAFLAPWISVDSDRYARVLVRANGSLKDYEISVRTNNAGLIGSVLRQAPGTTIDFLFVVFASDLTPSVTDLTLRADTLQPNRDYLNSIEIPEIPVALIPKRIGSTGALLMHLDLKKGTLKTADACYRSRDSENSTNPCTDASVAAMNQPNLRSIQSASRASWHGFELIPSARAQSFADVNSLITALGSRIPSDRTVAYTGLVAKCPAIFPSIIPVMTDLLAQRNCEDESYYRLLNLVNLSVELTNRGIDETNQFRSIIGAPHPQESQGRLAPRRWPDQTC